MTKVSTFTYKDQDVEVLYAKGKISYVFNVADRRYGNSVNVAGTTRQDFINACFALIINFIETFDAQAKS